MSRRKLFASAKLAPFDALILTFWQDVIEKDGNKAWREAYKAFID
jgi:hypothetical protein